MAGGIGEKINVGIAEMAISESPEMVLVAPNLGSCLGIAVYDPILHRGGLIHCLLPMSKSDPEKARMQPCMYVDTGVALLINKMIGLGSAMSNLRLHVAGGSQINDAQGVFNIGKKNYTVFRKIIWKNNLMILAEDVGGSFSRTLSLKIGSGEVWLRMGSEHRLLK